MKKTKSEVKMKISTLFNYLPKRMKILFAFEMILLLILSVFPAIILNYELQIFDNISYDSKFSDLLPILITIIIIIIVNAIVEYLYSKFNFIFGYKVRNILNNKIFSKINNINLIELENPEFFNTLNRIKGTVSDDFISYITGIFLIIKNIVISISTAIIVAKIHWSFPLIMFFGTIPYVFMFRKLNFNHYFQIMNNSIKTRKNHYIINILTSIEYNNEIKLYGIFDYLYEYHKILRTELFQESYALVKKYTFYAIILSLFKRLMYISCLIICIILIINGQKPIGYFVILLQSLSSLQSRIANILMKYKDLNRNTYSIKDFTNFMSYQDEVNGNELYGDSKAIEIKNLHFDYPSTKNVINDVSLKIPYGQKVAIVGINGSGKTTLMSLLMGIYAPLSGTITIGGKELNDCKETFRCRTSYIHQDFLKFKGTIKDNILLGLKNEVDDNEIIQLFHDIGEKEFLDKMPNGIYTELGFLEEGAIDISGGEWQKIALVRALINKDIDFLILDEFASALDAKTESNIYSKLNLLKYGKTIISISHRLGIVKSVDRIIVMKNGKIIEEGTHKQLMENRSEYFNMYNIQKKLYE